MIKYENLVKVFQFLLQHPIENIENGSITYPELECILKRRGYHLRVYETMD